jgi:F0F1-type ATP synthase delta subunit
MEQLDLSDFFQTKQAAIDFSSRLSAILDEVYKSNFNLENALLEQFGIEKKEKFLSLLRDCNISSQSQTALKTFLGTVQKQIAALPTLSIKIAFEPDSQTVKTISDWFIINMKKQVLLDIAVDKNIIAGCSISFDGAYQNFSIKPRLEQIISETIAADKVKAPDVPVPEIVAPIRIDLESFSLGR